MNLHPRQYADLREGLLLEERARRHVQWTARIGVSWPGRLVLALSLLGLELVR